MLMEEFSEFEMPTVDIFGYKLPISGGAQGYFLGG